jgi:hypothetical protein
VLFDGLSEEEVETMENQLYDIGNKSLKILEK